MKTAGFRENWADFVEFWQVIPTYSNLYHYAGNNPIKYTDPDGRMDDVPSFEELDNEYKVTERKFLAICEVSDEFSSLTSLIVSGNKKIEEVFLSCYINNLEKSNEKCTNITDFESLKTDVGLLAAYTIKKFGNSQIKVGISIIKISLFFKKLDYQSELNNIEEKMKKEYPKQFENKFNPTYKFGGGGASGSW
ncbi:MAG: hypothetical protein IKJ72_03340 [Mycoplasmataceae bacterium]|nr:hypothetical protein [Mycoplasmataceae bacterium]